MIRKKYICLFLYLLFLTSYSQAQETPTPFYSGIYSGKNDAQTLHLGVNEDEHTVSGEFRLTGPFDEVTKKLLWQCEFYFYGKLQADGSGTIIANEVGLDGKISSNSVTGKILPVSTGEDAVVVKLDSIFAGCKNATAIVNNEPLERAMPRQNYWLEKRVVLANRSYFYNSAGSKNPRKAYVSCGDVVTVIDENKVIDRVYVQYFGKKSETIGWLKRKDLLGVGEELKCR